MISIDLCAWTYTVRDYIKLLGAVPTSTVYVVTAGVCRNPVKYFTDKKEGAFAEIEFLFCGGVPGLE